MYLGHLAQLQETTISYKNHKRCAKDKKDWIVVHNNHEPIISQNYGTRHKKDRNTWHRAEEQRRDLYIRFQAFLYVRIAETN